MQYTTGTVRYGAVSYHTVRYGNGTDQYLRYCTVRYGTVRYGTVTIRFVGCPYRNGMVRYSYGTILSRANDLGFRI